jgi:predicted esterase
MPHILCGVVATWLLAGAILCRPLSPFRGDLPAHLDGAPVLIIDGEKDSRRFPGDGARLADRLARAAAMVSHCVMPVPEGPCDVGLHAFGRCRLAVILRL